MRSAFEIQPEIRRIMSDLYPRTQTHAEMGVRLEGFADLQQVASNMDKMAQVGLLELIRDGSQFESRTKKYRIARDHLVKE